MGRLLPTLLDVTQSAEGKGQTLTLHNGPTAPDSQLSDRCVRAADVFGLAAEWGKLAMKPSASGRRGFIR